MLGRLVCSQVLGRLVCFCVFGFVGFREPHSREHSGHSANRKAFVLWQFGRVGRVARLAFMVRAGHRAVARDAMSVATWYFGQAHPSCGIERMFVG